MECSFNKIYLLSLLFALLYQTACKGPLPDNSNIKSTTKNYIKEYQVKAAWSQEGKIDITLFDKLDELKVIPLSISAVASTGSIVKSTPKDWFSLHQSNKNDYPTYNIKLQTQGKKEWCFTPSPIKLGIKQKINCLNPESEKGKFARHCIVAKGKIAQTDKQFECIYKAKKDKNASIIFEKEYKEGEKIEYLYDFRTLSQDCKLKLPNDTSYINKEHINLCDCVDEELNKTISYNLWHVAAYFREIKKSPNLNTMRNDFKKMCINQDPLPFPPIKQKLDGPKNQLSENEKINLENCRRLKRFGTVLDYDEKSKTCLCYDFDATTTSEAGGNNGVSVTKKTPAEFIEACLNIKTAKTDNEFCQRVGMVEAEALNMPSNQTTLTCKRIYDLPAHKEICKFDRKGNKNNLFLECLKPVKTKVQNQ